MNENYTSLRDVMQHAQSFGTSIKDIRNIPTDTLIRLLVYGKIFAYEETIRIAKTYFHNEIDSDDIAVSMVCFYRKKPLAKVVLRTFYIRFGFHMLFQCDYTAFIGAIIHELCHLVLPKCGHNKEFYLLVEKKLLEAKIIDNEYNGWVKDYYPFRRMYYEPGKCNLCDEASIDTLRNRLFGEACSGERCLRKEYDRMYYEEFDRAAITHNITTKNVI